jgi:hypothetical protein
MENALWIATLLIEVGATSVRLCRVQSTLSHLPPRERSRALAPGKSTAAWEILMEPQTGPNHTPLSPELADDLLRADEIAAFIFGKTRSNRRKVYYLAETSRLPVFRLGAVLCARKSVLLGWISGQESRVRPHS